MVVMKAYIGRFKTKGERVEINIQLGNGAKLQVKGGGENLIDQSI